ncbi:PilZ domain-containing protein [Sphingomonas sp. R647]|uniref:PilZ domain-containing protein n=1 Tax=Sphingomonas sp. R647 TaxID=2875233 RepID=UPI0010DF28E5|nr:PilZ domain-containing protein [Sphingomonas sp. R647]MCA1196620.1 PilZ domain-containing protein [Sphingomonas sp. R647]RYD64689.1 MAG: PilZ domain-containing protein [Sphingomonadales bacterium]
MDQFSSDPFSGRFSDDPASQRNAVRDSLFLAATLRIEKVEVPVRVRNLSAGGLMAEYSDPVDSGTPVEINVRGVGWTRGHIAWSAEGRIGIAFDRPIDPLLARKPVGHGQSTPHYAKPQIFRG